MTTAYSNLLGLALPVTGELSGTWGDTVNDYITKYLDDAIANAQVISGSQTAVTLSKTTGTALVAAGSGSTGSAQYALIRCTGNPASTLTITVDYASLTNSQFSKTYLIFNSTSTNQSVVVRATTSSGTSTGVTIAAGERALIAWNGSDFVKIATQSGTGKFVTIEVTNIKANDGTAAMSIADSTGAVTVSTLLNVDNLRLDGNTLSSTDSNGNVVLAPNGTGDVQLDADTVRVGDSAAAVTLTSNGAGALTVTTGGAADLILNTNSGTNSGSITIGNGTNGNITVATNGTGDFYVDADTVRIGDSNANATITTNGTGDLILNTNSGTNSGSITIEDGVNGNIIIAPNGTGQVQISNAALDLTTIEVTNIKAKDGTASMSIADSTGAVTVSSAFAANGGVTIGDASGDAFTINSSAVSTPNGLNFDSNTFVIDAANNRVGIGQASPARALDVYGSIQAADASGIQTVLWSQAAAGVGGVGTNNNFPFALLTNGGEKVRVTTGGQVNIGGNFTSTNNTLQVTGNAAIGYTTAAPTTGLIVAGNVGIGTDSPGAKLDVRVSGATTALDGLYVYNGTAGGIFQTTGATYSYRGVGANNVWVGSNGGNDMYVGPSTANVLKFGNNAYEYMRIDTSGNVGIGDTNPAAKLTVLDTTANAATALVRLLGQNSYNLDIQSVTNGAGTVGNRYNFAIGSAGGEFSFSNSGGTLLTLNSSGNLGVGIVPGATGSTRVSSVASSSSAYSTAGAYPGVADATIVGYGASNTSNTTGSFATYQGAVRSTAADIQVGGMSFVSASSGYAPNITFWQRSGASTYAEIARFDTSGNLGLGVTPTNNTLGTTFQNEFAALTADGTTPKFWLGSNWYYNGGDKYLANGQASLYSQQSGQHIWWYASNNTSGAGAVMSPVQAMTLDASGNLGVGTTSPIAFSNQTSVTVNGTNTGRFDIRQGGTHTAALVATSTYVDLTAITNVPLTFGTNSTERARITSGGNLDLQKNIGLGGTSATTSGTGITFPATQSDSSDANTLDDYEEGTWTPVLRDGPTGNAATATISGGSYVKIGRFVTATCRLVDIVTTGLTAGNLIYITGLPFASNANANFENIGHVQRSDVSASVSSLYWYIGSNVSYASLGNDTAAGQSNAVVSQITSGSGDIRATFIYQV